MKSETAFGRELSYPVKHIAAVNNIKHPLQKLSINSLSTENIRNVEAITR